nr:serine:threonine protein phosphatase 2A [Hymenolepis microstoma]
MLASITPFGQDLWNALKKSKEASVDGTKWFITYPNFLKTKQECTLPHLTAVFSCTLTYNLSFSLHPTHVNEVDHAFTPYYVSSVICTLLFFLEHLCVGRIRICVVLASGFIETHCQLADASTTKAQLEENRFSLQRTRRVYATFLQLDADQSSMLSRAELAGFNGDSLTDAFLDSVFQACPTYESEVDFKVYLDMVVAVENCNEPQSIAIISCASKRRSTLQFETLIG